MEKIASCGPAELLSVGSFFSGRGVGMWANSRITRGIKEDAVLMADDGLISTIKRLGRPENDSSSSFVRYVLCLLLLMSSDGGEGLERPMGDVS